MITRPTAIETTYRGYRFRSRLEARWAVFFDTLRVPFEYEREGFDLREVEPPDEDSGATPTPLHGADAFYLPDFFLPVQDCWIEIKGDKPTAVEEERAYRLAYATGKKVYTFFGECWLPCGEDGSYGADTDSAYVHYPEYGWDNFQHWCECRHCGIVGIQFDGRSARLPCDCADKHAHPKWGPSDKDYNTASPRLKAAYAAARAARFEFGETPLLTHH